MNYLAMAQVFSEWFDNNPSLTPITCAEDYSDIDPVDKACYVFLELLGFDSSDCAAVVNEYYNL